MLVLQGTSEGLSLLHMLQTYSTNDKVLSGQDILKTFADQKVNSLTTESSSYFYTVLIFWKTDQI